MFHPDEEYIAVPVIPSTGIHDPFCYDPSCPCHEDQALIGEVAEAYNKGEITAQEATDFVNGKMV